MGLPVCVFIFWEVCTSVSAGLVANFSLKYLAEFVPKEDCGFYEWTDRSEIAFSRESGFCC